MIVEIIFYFRQGERNYAWIPLNEFQKFLQLVEKSLEL